jgi:hypothetical protein
MSTKVCFKCGIDKPLLEYYAHKQMQDGHLNKCKICTKSDTKRRIDKLSSNPQWIESERKRGRDKYYRLGYKSKGQSDVQKRYKEKYPEKYKAKCAIGMIKAITKGNHLHHWSYNEEHYKDVIEITPKQHAKAHRFIVYDQERMMYRRFDTNVLLDTRESHENFINYCITNLED